MAGTEAAGTSNMKFSLNGALTISTWDGANIEMAHAIGQENMFMFGLNARDVRKFKEVGYDPRLYLEENRQLKGVVDAIASGEFSRGDPHLYRPLVESLINRDSYLVMADFAPYVQTQLQVDALYCEPERWAECALRNMTAMGEFSADRAVAQYVERVWSVTANS
jgi:starch phosphorylase